MNWKAISTEALSFLVGIVIAGFAYLALGAAGLHSFLANDYEGLNTIILLVGGIYSVVFAFVIFVIWGQFTDVQNAVMRECNTLNDILRFSDHLNPDSSRAIHRAVADYSQRVLKHEWKALA